MMAMVDGMAAHGGLIPFGSTFFTFSDYCRSAIRMGALRDSHSLYLFTHDSVGLREDGPTYQPIGHLMALRAIPQLTDFRPVDANETAACWQLAVMDPDQYGIFAGVRRGAYRLVEGDQLILIATGSEVQVVLEAARRLLQANIRAAVISMPSFRLFEEQDAGYRRQLFPPQLPAISVEAGATLGWYKYIGREGVAIGIDRFGASAPGVVVLQKLGIGVEHVLEAAHALLKR
jgi:transketolase